MNRGTGAGFPMKRRTAGFLLFFCLVLIYNSNLRLIRAGDTIPASLIPLSLSIDHAISLDRFEPYYSQHSAEGAFFLKEHEGHFYSIYPVALPLMVTPIYLPVVWVLGASSWPVERLVFLAAVMEKVVASLIASFTTLLLFLLLARIVPRKRALFLSLIFALCTNTWTISSQALWQHGASQMFVVCSMLFFFLALESGRHREMILAGLFAALSVAVRPTNIVLFSCILLYLLFTRRPIKATLCFLIFPGLVGISLAIYNLWLFNDIMGFYGSEALTSNLLTGLGGTLMSPSRGLFIYSPFLLFILPGIYFWIRGERDLPSPLFLVSAAFILGHTVVVGKYYSWWGGNTYGPRYMTDVLPCMILLLIPSHSWVERHMPLKVMFLLTVVASFSVQVVGAFFYPRGQWNNVPVSVTSDPSRLWNWKDSQIVRTVRAGPDLSLHRKLLGGLSGMKSDSPRYGVEYIEAEGPPSVEAGRMAVYGVVLVNEGGWAWNNPREDGALSGLSLSYHWYKEGGECVIWDGLRSNIPGVVRPGERVKVRLGVKAPPMPGNYTLRIDLVEEGVTWFSWHGNDPLRLKVVVTPQHAFR